MGIRNEEKRENIRIGRGNKNEMLVKKWGMRNEGEKKHDVYIIKRVNWDRGIRERNYGNGEWWKMKCRG